jgi:hypothetical protein
LQNEFSLGDATSCAVKTIFESSEFAEAPKKIRNLQEPPKDSGISIITDTRVLSDTVPECNQRNGFWRYNYPAFDQLIKI